MLLDDYALYFNLKGSRRLEIDRPPTRSGGRAETKKVNDNLFDDDDSDVLGGMGLDDSSKTTKKTVKKTDDDDRGKVHIFILLARFFP